MPYLDSKIDSNQHKKDCGNPVAKRLYIRDYDDEGKQRFVPWGLTCTSCGVVIPNEEKYQHNLSPKELEFVELEKKSDASGWTKMTDSLRVSQGDKPKSEMSIEERLERERAERLANKLKRLQRKDKQPITDKERGLRMQIRNMWKFYTRMSNEIDDPSESKLIGTVWDEKLVDQFLNLNPRPAKLDLENVIGSKQDSDYAEFELSVRPGDGLRRGRRWWGYVQDPDKPGWIKYDWKAYMELLLSEAERRKELMRMEIKNHGIEPIDSSPDYIPWHNPYDVQLGKMILELGGLMEENRIVPSHEICIELVKKLVAGKEGDDADRMKSDIERLCPPEWKQATIKSVISE